MGNQSCIYSIHSLMDHFSAKEKEVAEFVLANPGVAVHPSIEELAEKIGVSESTLVRFVKKLGYSGYQQFRIALATETMSPESLVYEAPIDAYGDDAALVFASAIKSLELTLSHLSRATLARIVTAITAARRLFILGTGGSGIVAQDACHKLIRTGLTCLTASDFHVQLMLVSQAGPQDYAIVISHTGANKDTIALADGLRHSECHFAVMTSSPKSPLARMGDELLVSVAPARTPVSEAFSARIAQLAIVDTLYVKIMEALGSNALGSIEKMRGAIAGRKT